MAKQYRGKRVKEQEARREELLANLWTQGADLQDIARAMNCSLTELAKLAAEGEFRATLRRLCALGNMRSKLITSRYRVHAAAKLVALASEGEGEVARKASVDLMKMGVETRKPRGRGKEAVVSGGPIDADAGVADTEEVLEALRQLGEVKHG